MRLSARSAEARTRAAPAHDAPELAALRRELLLGYHALDLDGQGSGIAGHLSARLPGTRPDVAAAVEGGLARQGSGDAVAGVAEVRPRSLRAARGGAAGAAGLAVRDWFDIRLADPETDEEVPVGQGGELGVRTARPFTLCSGHFAMPERTAEAIRNCWFHTGDGMRRDAEGWYYFVDRLKDSIRRRGENISSYEVEQAVLQHDAVAECAVVAVPADQEANAQASRPNRYRVQ